MSNGQQTLEEFIRGESGGGVADALVASVEPEAHTMPVHDRCPACPILELSGTICNHPGIGEFCPACAYQTPIE